MNSWLKKIGLLKKLLSTVGHLWNGGTRLAGFENKGPYSCSRCEYLKDGNRCTQPVMIADPEVKKDSKGLPIIDFPKTQCCEFVEIGESK